MTINANLGDPNANRISTVCKKCGSALPANTIECPQCAKDLDPYAAWKRKDQPNGHTSTRDLASSTTAQTIGKVLVWLAYGIVLLACLSAIPSLFGDNRAREQSLFQIISIMKFAILPFVIGKLLARKKK